MQDWNDSELQHFKEMIQARLADLAEEADLGRAGEAIVTLDQQSVGRLCRMDALQNQAMAKAQQARRAIEETRLLGALGRLDTGEYGYCEDCGERIAVKRLELDLAATRCVSCQSG
ncbi:MAG: TraR/DksA C4-type zinc finger protein [Pseudomonadota bacterium]